MKQQSMCLTSTDSLLGWSQSLDNGNGTMTIMNAKILLCYAITVSLRYIHESCVIRND